MNTNKFAITLFVLFFQYGIYLTSLATLAGEVENKLYEKSMKIHIGTPLKDGLNILRINPDVSSIELDNGDIDLSYLLKDSIIYIVTFKNSNDALFVLADRKNNEENYKINDLMIYPDWKIDFTKPKKLRNGKIEHIYSFPY